ncbi:MAG: hypothetical protein SCK28_04080 [Bacillota bacterium]|nr:hypothetical protein [Bacillota bacterium]
MLLNQRGSSLTLLLGTAVLLFTLVLSINYWLRQDLRIKEAYADNGKAFYLSEAGVEEALWHLAHNYNLENTFFTSGIEGYGTYSTEITNIERIQPLPENEEEPDGILIATINSLGSANGARERIITKVELTYGWDGSISFKTASFQRAVP